MGCGLGFPIQKLDEKDLEGELARREPGSTFDVDSPGGEVSMLDIVGLDFRGPQLDWVCFFVEGRAGIGLRLTTM